MHATTVQFATAARLMGDAARGLGLVVPAFRSPPRRRDASRTVRRWRGGGATVSVEVAGRPLEAVVADMVEGVVVVNGIDGPAATEVRTTLWQAVLASDRDEQARPPIELRPAAAEDGVRASAA